MLTFWWRYSYNCIGRKQLQVIQSKYLKKRFLTFELLDRYFHVSWWKINMYHILMWTSRSHWMIFLRAFRRVQGQKLTSAMMQTTNSISQLKMPQYCNLWPPVAWSRPIHPHGEAAHGCYSWDTNSPQPMQCKAFLMQLWPTMAYITIGYSKQMSRYQALLAISERIQAT